MNANKQQGQAIEYLGRMVELFVPDDQPKVKREAERQLGRLLVARDIQRGTIERLSCLLEERTGERDRARAAIPEECRQCGGLP